MQWLNGGSGDDTFTLGNSGVVSGILDGGSGSNRLNGRAQGDNDWLITDTLSSVSHVFAFRNMQHLYGGNGVDTFTLNGTPNGNISGTVNGMAGDDIFNISVAITGQLLGGEGNDTFNINSHDLNIASIDGGTGSNTLRGANESSRWQLTGSHNGTLITVLGVGGLALKEITFANINRLQGGTADDWFMLNNVASLETLTIDGGDNRLPGNTVLADTVDLSTLTGGLRIVLGGSGISNIETLLGNSDPDTVLVGEERDNSWLINGINSGAVGGMQFSGMTHLQSGAANDSFAFSDTLTAPFGGRIDGAAGRDTINYSNLKEVVVTVGNAFDTGTGSRISSIEGVVGGLGSTLKGTDYDSLWTLNGGSGGTVKYQTIGNNPEQVTLFFDGFSTLLGGAGSDTLKANVSGTMNGALHFNGGAGSNSVQLTGGGNGYSETYRVNDTQGEFAFSSGDNRYTLALSNVTSIRDDVTAPLTVYGTAANDTFVLNSGTFAVNGALPVQYSNKNSITFDGVTGDADAITVQVDLTLPGTVTFSAATVTSTPGATVTADTLTLNRVNGAGTATDRLQSDVKNMQLINSGGLYLENRGDLNLTRLSTTGAVDLRVNGNINSTAPLVADHALTLTAAGNISLTNATNTLRGPLGLKATTGKVTLNNGSNTTLARVDARSVALDVAGDLVSSDGIHVTGNSRLSATQALTITGNNDFGSVELSADTIELHDSNSIDVTRAQASRSIAIHAEGTIGTGSLTAPQVALTSNGGQIIDTNGNADNIIADKVILRASSGIGLTDTAGLIDGLETRTAILDVINQNGNIGINNRGKVQVNTLVTQGNIAFKNEQSVSVDKIDAGYESGVVTIDISNGSLYGYAAIPTETPTQRSYKTTPDIIADRASIKATGDVGTQYEPVSVSINREFALLSNVGSVYYYGGKPAKIIDDSSIKVSVFNDLSASPDSN